VSEYKAAPHQPHPLQGEAGERHAQGLGSGWHVAGQLRTPLPALAERRAAQFLSPTALGTGGVPTAHSVGQH